MNFEAYQEQQVERLVDAVFEDLSEKSTEERMGIAAFELLAHIEEERVANDEVLKAWTENGKAPAQKFHVFGNAVLLGFTHLGLGFMPGVIAPEQLPKLPPTQLEDTAEQEKRLENARTRMHQARITMAEIYGFSLKEIKKTEAIARELSSPSEH